MKAAWYERNGPAREVLIVGEQPDPQPAKGEVRVRLATSGVNPSDWKARMGIRPMLAPMVIPHSDGAGVIDMVGEGVSPQRIGQRVWVWNGQWKRVLGTAATMITLPEEQAVALPDATSFAAGACFGIPALTAYRAVTVDGSVKGQSVLVMGGAGSVGHYAIQCAKLLGARQIIATVSSPEKAERAKQAGADLVINYRTQDVVAEVLAATGNLGVDRVVEVDAAGHAGILPKLVRQDGLCVVYGTNTPQVTYDFVPMIMSGVAVRFFIVYELAREPRREAIATLTGWLEQGLLQHQIAAEFPLADIALAHEAVESGKLIGNVVISLPD